MSNDNLIAISIITFLISIAIAIVYTFAFDNAIKTEEKNGSKDCRKSTNQFKYFLIGIFVTAIFLLVWYIYVLSCESCTERGMNEEADRLENLSNVLGKQAQIQNEIGDYLDDTNLEDRLVEMGDQRDKVNKYLGELENRENKRRSYKDYIKREKESFSLQEVKKKLDALSEENRELKENLKTLVRLQQSPPGLQVEPRPGSTRGLRVRPPLRRRVQTPDIKQRLIDKQNQLIKEQQRFIDERQLQNLSD